MAQPAIKNESLTNSTDKSKDSPENIHKTLSARQSKELVLALCGPIGCGIDTVKDQLKMVLDDEGYEVIHIRISRLIEEYCQEMGIPFNPNHGDRASRYNSLMDAGNTLRDEYGERICANLAIGEINSIRQKDVEGAKPEGENAGDLLEDKKIALNKRAYILDQLKHPEEVAALKNIYGDLFYLVGVLCDQSRREVGLSTEGIPSEVARELINRDKSENHDHGQHLEDTLYHADFFINNSNPNASATKSLFTRFMKLLHGGRGVTPTKEEYGMYAAYSASMQSACLSRQVGASIVDNDGNILAVGRNDVPKFGGGLYTEDDGLKDYRCVHKDQQCHNDLHKKKLKLKIREVLTIEIEKLNTEGELGSLTEKIDIDSWSNSIVSNTPIKSLIEYSRAIHAEMDAIIALTRQGKKLPFNSTLYTTTFPCHNCARHIVAAGITTIKYIQPYEKSLALTLHDDALSYTDPGSKVQLMPFQGVAPSRYNIFFSNTSPEKNSEGKMIITDKADRLLVDSVYVDSYLERELKVAADLIQIKKQNKYAE